MGECFNRYNCYNKDEYCMYQRCCRRPEPCCCEESCCPQPPCCPKPERKKGCICVEQMKYLLAQIILYYPTEAIEFTMQDGSTVTGIPTSIAKGLLAITAGEAPNTYTVYVCVAKIASFEITTAVYDPQIRYLTAACYEECECAKAFEALVEVDDTVTVTAGGVTTTAALIAAEAPGILALTLDGNVIFVSTCAIDTLAKVTPAP